MSRESYRKAIELMNENKNECHFIGARSEILIKIAEKRLDLKFVGTYLEFLRTFGAGNFGSQEIYGLIDDDFENSSIPDAIWYTIIERREINLPNNLLIIYDNGIGELYCIDFNQQNEEREPCVVSYIPGIDNNEQEYGQVACDFGDLLYELVKNQLSR